MPTLAEGFIPVPDASERHSIVITAPRERVWEAVRRPDPSDARLVKPLFALRNMISRLLNGHAQRDMPTFTALAEEPGREVVLGTVGQWWRLGRSKGVGSVGTAEEFTAFDRPGYAKGTFSFVLEEAGPGRIRLVTETRVAATSPDARRAFLRYWAVIRLGSGLVRWAILSSIKARTSR